MRYLIIVFIFLTGCSSNENTVENYSKRNNVKCESYRSSDNCSGGYWESGTYIDMKCDFHYWCSDNKEFIQRM